MNQWSDHARIRAPDRFHAGKLACGVRCAATQRETPDTIICFARTSKIIGVVEEMGGLLIQTMLNTCLLRQDTRADLAEFSRVQDAFDVLINCLLVPRPPLH